MDNGQPLIEVRNLVAHYGYQALRNALATTS